MTNGQMYGKGMRICEKCGGSVINDICTECYYSFFNGCYMEKGYIHCEECGVRNKEETWDKFGHLPKTYPCRVCGHELLTETQKEGRTKIYVRDMDRLSVIIQNLDRKLQKSEKSRIEMYALLKRMSEYIGKKIPSGAVKK